MAKFSVSFEMRTGISNFVFLKRNEYVRDGIKILFGGKLFEEKRMESFSKEREEDDDGVVEYEEGDEDGGERVLQSRERRQRDRVQIGSGKDLDVGGF